MYSIIQKTVILCLVLVTFYNCAVFQKKEATDDYVYCQVQNLAQVQTGDKKLDKQREKAKLKYTKNRKSFYRFYIDFFEELTKDKKDVAKILKHFEDECNISYNGIASEKSAEFINYMDYLNSYTTDDDYLLETMQCGGKNRFKMSLTCKPKRKTVTWWFVYSNNHKIKLFKETIAVAEEN